MKISIQPLVSVITPVYNAEKYLTECIESVLAQTYNNWEYIIVNNCSTDGSPGIIRGYVDKHKRILLHNNMEFVSAIENHHIAYRQISSESKYCKVVHADDWLFPECLEKMVALGENYPAVGIVGSYRLDGAWVTLDGLPYPSHVTPGREVCRSSLLGGPYVFGSPTSLLIRSDIVRKRDPFYDEPNFSLQADIAACYDILMNSDFGYVHQVLTYTRRHEGTQTTVTQAINSYNWVRLMLLRKYGSSYLKQEEYDRLFKNGINDYYRFLAKSIFQKGGKEFRQYHEDKLRKLGCPISKAKLSRAVLFQIIDILLDQKRLAAAIVNRIKPINKLL